MESGRGIAMARVRGKKSDRDDVAVKVDRKLVSMARVVAARKGVTVAELLSELLDAPVRRVYAAMVKELNLEGESEAQ